MNKSITEDLDKGSGNSRPAAVRTVGMSRDREINQNHPIGPVTIAAFIAAINQLPSDPPVDNPAIWYKTQKQHWLGWLSEYNSPGAYGRQVTKTREAKYAYNHIVNYQMLLWIIKAAGVDAIVVSAAEQASMEPATLQGASAAIRRIVPWETLASALWGQG